jgi:hypothetical protein
MAKKVRDNPATYKARFEFRVWGEYPEAEKLMRKLASLEEREQIEDCYLLVGDPVWNAKVRDNSLKIKQLIAEDKGFERWRSGRVHSSDGAPSPFDVLFDELSLDMAPNGESVDLARAVEQLDPELGVRAVFVVKRRRRYWIGSLRAEATKVEIVATGEVMRTVSVEGDDLDELVRLRKKLGLKGEENIPVHEVLESEL